MQTQPPLQTNPEPEEEAEVGGNITLPTHHWNQEEYEEQKLDQCYSLFEGYEGGYQKQTTWTPKTEIQEYHLRE